MSQYREGREESADSEEWRDREELGDRDGRNGREEWGVGEFINQSIVYQSINS